MADERCGLCANARPLYSPADRHLVKSLGRNVAMVCMECRADEPMPLVFDDTNARAEFGWHCFVPFRKDWQ